MLSLREGLRIFLLLNSVGYKANNIKNEILLEFHYIGVPWVKTT